LRRSRVMYACARARGLLEGEAGGGRVSGDGWINRYFSETGRAGRNAIGGGGPRSVSWGLCHAPSNGASRHRVMRCELG